MYDEDVAEVTMSLTIMCSQCEHLFDEKISVSVSNDGDMYGEYTCAECGHYRCDVLFDNQGALNIKDYEGDV